MLAPEMLTIDPERAMATLDYQDMRNLATMFEGWAMDKRRLDAQQRDRVLALSSDYEELAAFCGPEWKATVFEQPPDPVVFIARRLRAEP